MANKEAVFSLRVDTGNSVKEIQAFEQGLNDATDAIEKNEQAASNLGARFDEVYGEMLPLTGALGEAEDRLYQLALAGDTASEEYQGLLERVSQYRRVQMDTDMVVDQASKTFSEKLVGSVETSAAVFQGFQSVTALVGEENEALVQTMVKLQAVQGVVNAIQTISQKLKEKDVLVTGVQTVAQKVYALAVGTTTGAMKALRIALLATGIGAIIVGILAAADALGLFSDGSEEAEKAQKELEKALEATNKQIQDQQALTEAVTKVIDQRIQADINAAKLAGASQEEINQITKDAAKERLAVLEAEETAATNLYKKKSSSGSMAEFVAAEKAMLVATEKAAAARLAIKTQEANEEAERQKKATEAGQKAAEAAKKRREEEYKAEQDRLKNLQALYNEYLANIEAAETEYYDSLLTDQQREEQAVNDKFYNLIEQAKQHGDDTTTLELAQAHALAVIRKKFDDERLAKIAETEQKNLDLLRSYQSLVLSEQENELIAFEDQQKEKSKKLSEALAAGVITEQQFMEAQLVLEQEYAKKKIELNKATNQAIKDSNTKSWEEQTKNITKALEFAQMGLDQLGAINNLLNQIGQNRLNTIKEQQDAELKSLDDKQAAALNNENLTAEQKTKIEKSFAQQKQQVQLKAFNEEEKIKKAQFARDKALRIAQAAIDTASAVIKSIAQGGGIPSGIPFGIAAAAMGAAQIATIAAQKYQGGTAPSAASLSGGATGATGAGASTFTANTNTQQTETAGLLNGQGQQGGVTQVVVVESDITNVQNKVSAQQALSTY